MTQDVTDHSAFVGRIYRDAMRLAQEASNLLGFTLHHPTADYRSDNPEVRASQVVETMRMSNRLMHVIAWALLHKAAEAGEVDRSEPVQPDNRLAHQNTPPPVCDEALQTLPDPVGHLVSESEKLLDRAMRWERALIDGLTQPKGNPNPVHQLQDMARRLT